MVLSAFFHILLFLFIFFNFLLLVLARSSLKKRPKEIIKTLLAGGCLLYSI